MGTRKDAGVKPVPPSPTAVVCASITLRPACTLRRAEGVSGRDGASGIDALHFLDEGVLCASVAWHGLCIN